MYSYVTLDAFKQNSVIDGLGEDAELRTLLEAAAGHVDTYLNRTLRTYLATYYFTADSPVTVRLDSGQTGLGLLTVTTLKTDKDGDRTYETTWATTDYDMPEV